MKSEEEQYIITRNQVKSSDAALEDVRCTAADISQFNSESSNSLSPIRIATCERVVSASLVKPSSQEYQVLQDIKSDDLTREIHSQEGFLPFADTCLQKCQKDYCEPYIHVKSEKIESDECVSKNEEPRKWVVSEGGLLKEVLKVEHRDWPVETSKDSSETNNQKEERYRDSLPQVSELSMNIEPYISCASTEQFKLFRHPTGDEQMNTDEKQYSCSTYGQRGTHQNIPRGVMLYNCSIYGKSSSRSSSGNIYGRNLTGVPYVCRTCGQSIKQFCQRASHEQTHTRLKPHICATCGKSFALSSYLKAHQRIHSGSKPHVCTTCGKSFALAGNCKTHELIHTGEKPHACVVCGKSFTQFNSLKVHERIHSGLKPISCSTCGKSFSDPRSLYKHEQIHTGIKPYKCATCGKLFTTSSQCKTHGNTHTGLKLFTCATCGKTFTTSSHCKTHARIHTGVRPHTCATCGKSFTQSTSLKVHERIHARVKPSP